MCGGRLFSCCCVRFYTCIYRGPVGSSAMASREFLLSVGSPKSERRTMGSLLPASFSPARSPAARNNAPRDEIHPPIRTKILCFCLSLSSMLSCPCCLLCVSFRFIFSFVDVCAVVFRHLPAKRSVTKNGVPLVR